MTAHEQSLEDTIPLRREDNPSGSCPLDPRQLRAILDAAARRIKKGAGIGHDEFWKQVESAKPAGEGNGKKRRARRES